MQGLQYLRHVALHIAHDEPHEIVADSNEVYGNVDDIYQTVFGQSLDSAGIQLKVVDAFEFDSLVEKTARAVGEKVYDNVLPKRVQKKLPRETYLREVSQNNNLLHINEDGSMATGFHDPLEGVAYAFAMPRTDLTTVLTHEAFHLGLLYSHQESSPLRYVIDASHEELLEPLERLRMRGQTSEDGIVKRIVEPDKETQERFSSSYDQRLEMFAGSFRKFLFDGAQDSPSRVESLQDPRHKTRLYVQAIITANRILKG